MSSLLKEKLGLVNQHTSVEDAVNAIVKLLNQSKKDDGSDTIANETVYGLNGEEYSSPFTITFNAGDPYTKYVDIIITHGLGAIPNGFLITDLTCNPAGTDFSGPIVTRLSWTASQAVFRINMYASISFGSWTSTGSIKILLLR